MIFDLIAQNSGSGKFIFIDGREYPPLSKGVACRTVGGDNTNLENTGEYLKTTPVVGGQQVLWICTSPIDVTRLKKIYVEVERCKTTADGKNDWSNYCRFGVTDELYLDDNGGATHCPYGDFVIDGRVENRSLFVYSLSNSFATVPGCAYTTIPNTETLITLEVDVSELTGKKYIGFECQGMTNYEIYNYGLLIKKIYTK